jgi:hypothetical protein
MTRCRHEVKVENGACLRATASRQEKKPHPPHRWRGPQREPGPVRVAHFSLRRIPPTRASTSSACLKSRCPTREKLVPDRLIKLAELKFRAAKLLFSAQACTWPCSITQMDDTDEMTEVYEALVHWADVVLLATPIRWGQAGSLYFRMAERLNCVQNQITIRDRVLIRNKVAGFIITGGQDNIQGVAGQLLSFFSELGFYLPQFPFGPIRAAGRQDMGEHRRGAAQRGVAGRAPGHSWNAPSRRLRSYCGAVPVRKTARGEAAHRLEVERRSAKIILPGSAAYLPARIGRATAGKDAGAQVQKLSRRTSACEAIC